MPRPTLTRVAERLRSQEGKMAETLIGKVNHWFGRIGVIGVELTDQLAVGDRIHVLGHTTDFDQTVTSMQIMHQDVAKAGAGDGDLCGMGGAIPTSPGHLPGRGDLVLPPPEGSLHRHCRGSHPTGSGSRRPGGGLRPFQLRLDREHARRPGVWSGARADGSSSPEGTTKLFEPGGRNGGALYRGPGEASAR